MTNKEAITILKDLWRYEHTEHTDEEVRNALNMAIKALEQEPCREQADYENEIEDLHNRLDIAEYDKERLREEVTEFEEKIKALEQEPCEDCIRRQAVNEIITDIRDCISVEGYWAILERLKKLPPVKQEPDGDVISREAVIEGLNTINGTAELDKAFEVIERIPPVKQEPCEDEYIKVPKKALKYRTAGMVAYNAEWLKNHFDIERVAICGEQQPCEDCISRQAVLDINESHHGQMPNHINHQIWQEVKDLPSVQPKPRTGHWIEDAKTYYEELNKRGLGVDEYTPYFTDDIACSECLAKYSMLDNETQFFKCCPNCGAKMEG